MNNLCYRVVFNESLNAWVAVDETVSARGKRSRGRVRRMAAMLALLGTTGIADAQVRHNLPQVATGARMATNVGVSSIDTVGRTMTVHQSLDTAIQNWDSFDIAAGHKVVFDQQSSSWRILNRIWDSKPSEIFGSIEAKGQVYLINRNGIRFGPDGQVNVGGLVASALNIRTDVFKSGFLSVAGKDAAFYYAGKIDTASGEVIDFDTPASSAAALGDKRPDVSNAGHLKAADGGSIMLLAPVVKNSGSIETNSGQVVLAAGAKVYLSESGSTSLRGLLVEVDPFAGGDKTSSSVSNTGSGEREITVDEVKQKITDGIVANRGNITLAAMAVNNDGLLKVTTSKTENGSIYLQGRHSTTTLERGNVGGGSVRRTQALATQGGEVVLGANSRVEAEVESITDADVEQKAATDFVADAADSAAVQASKLAAFKDLIRKQYTVAAADTLKPSEIVVDGRSVLLKTGSSITAPGASVSLLAAGERIYEANKEGVETYLSTAKADVGASVVLESGASVDVAGYKDVAVDGSRNQMKATLVSNELKDAPLQRAGILSRQTVSFNRLDAPTGKLAIADASGAVEGIQYSLRERAATGGAVTIQSAGDVVLGAGSKINVSGGSVNYSAADIVTTQLTAGSLRFDIDKASADIVYERMSSSARHVAEYAEGKDAGSVLVAARGAVALDGSLQGQTVNGVYQTTASTAAKGASFTLGDQLGNFSKISEAYPQASTQLPMFSWGRAVVVSDEPALAGADGANRVSVNRLSAAGFSSFKLYGESISVAADSPISLSAASSLSLRALGDVDIDADVRGAGMKFDAQAGRAGSSIGSVRLAAGRSLDASGIWINDWAALRQGAALYKGLRQIDAGSISLTAISGMELGAGSRIDVSGGGSLSASGSLKTGNAGAITLAGDGGVELNDASLRGQALAAGMQSGKGGSLTITAPGIRINDAAQNAAELVLNSDLFSQGGFSNYAMTASVGNAGIGAGTQLDLTRSVRQLGNIYQLAATGSALSALGRDARLDASIKDPASFTLSASFQNLETTGVENGVLTIGEGAQIKAGAGGSITLNAGRQLTLAGELVAAGGKVALNMIRPGGDKDPGAFEDQSIFLTDSARIDVAGTALVTQNARGLRTGEVLNGGSVSINAAKGHVIAQEGARILLDGSSATLDNLSTGRSALVASNAGSLSLQSPAGILFGAQISAKSGGATAAGGTFTLNLEKLQDSQYSNSLRKVTVGENLLAEGRDLKSQLAALRAGNSLKPLFADKAQGWVDSQALATAGFDSLAIRSDDSIRFEGNVALAAARQIALTARSFDVADANVTIDAAAVRLGGDIYQGQRAKISEETLFTQDSVGGNGSLSVRADSIALWGGSSVNGARQTTLSSRGELSVSNVYKQVGDSLTYSDLAIFSVGGNLDLEASQIYPTTYSDFTVKVAPGVNGEGGTLNIRGPGTAPGMPLSAGSRLVLEADSINQGGVVRAPFGTIELNARKNLNLLAGSVTSASGNGAVIPYGELVNGTDWSIDPSGIAQPISGAPTPSIALRAPVVEQAEGALVDVSGGGDLQALEFVPGAGGSADVLKQANTYAIIPGYASAYAPESGAFDQQAGTQITLGAEAGLPAGTYTLLPARYAMLPGAYKVTLLSGYRDAASNLQIGQALGGTVVSGRLSVANTAVSSAQSVGVLVEPVSVTSQRSEFTDARASTFFEKQATNKGVALTHVTADAGQLIIAASERIRLNGELDMLGDDDGTGKRRRGGMLDISLLKSSFDAEGKPAGSILVGEGTNATGLQISEAEIAKVGAESVLIGGERKIGSEGVSIGVTARDVRYQGSASLQDAAGSKPAEVIVAATNSLTVASGSVIETAAPDAVRPVSLQASVVGDGALLRVAADNTVVQRSGVSAKPERGRLIVESGVKLKGESVQIDATLDSQIASNSAATAKSFTLGANAISLGGSADLGTNGGTRLGGDLLASVAGSAGEITLRSYTGIRFDESFSLGSSTPVKQLTLDGPSIEWAGTGAGTVQINGQSLTLTNTTGALASASSGSGSLVLNAMGSSADGSDAGVLKIAAGDMALRGFADTSLSATRGVVFSGSGTTSATGPLSIATPIVTVASGANHKLKTDAALNLTAGSADAADALSAGSGGSLVLEGSSANVATQIVSRSGSLGIKASSGDITLVSGALMDVSSRETAFSGGTQTTDAGRIILESKLGQIDVQSGSTLDLQGRGDSSAGSLTLNAPKGEVKLGGTLHAGVADGMAAASAGKLVVDAGRIADVNALIRSTQEFEGQRSIRLREGDMGVTEAIKAYRIGLYADQGDIRIDSLLDARGPFGGSIDIAARAAVKTLPNGSHTVQGGHIELGSAAVLDASAFADGGTGGTVSLSVSGAAAQTIDGVTYTPEDQAEIHFANGSRIDVRGKGTGADGSVTLNAPRQVNLADYSPVSGSVVMVADASVFTVPVAATTADLAPVVALATQALPLAGKTSSAYAVTSSAISFTGVEYGTVVDFVAEVTNATTGTATNLGTTLSLNGSAAYKIKLSQSSTIAAGRMRAGGSYRLKFQKATGGAANFWQLDTTVTPLAVGGSSPTNNGVTLLSLAVGSGFTGSDNQIVYFSAESASFGGAGTNQSNGGVRIKTGTDKDKYSTALLYAADGSQLGAGSLVAGTAYVARYDATAKKFVLLSSTGAHESVRIVDRSVSSLPGESLAIRFTPTSNASNDVELQLNGDVAGRIYESDGLTPLSVEAGKTYTVSRLSDGRYALRPKAGYSEVTLSVADPQLVAFSLSDLGKLTADSGVKLAVNGAAAMTLLGANGNALDAGALQAGKTYVASLANGRYRLVAEDSLASAVAISNAGVVLEGVPQVTVNAFKTYSSDTLDSSLRDTAQAEAQQYAYWLPKITAGLGSLNNGQLVVRPGIEIRSTGALTLANDWNLAAQGADGKAAWRYQDGSVAGALVIRAAGALNLDASINDGFKDASSATPGSLGDGWDLSLVAGADLEAANVLAVKDGSSEKLKLNKLVRTGTGDIRLAAAGDIDLSASGAGVYSAGGGNGGAAGDMALSGKKTWLTSEGGDVSLHAGGDLIGRAVSSDPVNWLWRTSVSKATTALPAATAVSFDQFDWVSGALGGGDVSLSAGGTIRDMTVALPAQMKFGFDSDGKPNSVNALTGGNLSVQAGGDIRGGSFLVENGAASLSAGGSLAEGASGVRLYAANTRFAIVAASDLSLGNIQNASMLNQSSANASTVAYQARWSSYTADSLLDLRSAAGAVSLAGTPDSVLPASLKVVALGGDISIGAGSNLAMSPAANGQLALYAEGSVSKTQISMIDANPEQVDSALKPLDGNHTGAGKYTKKVPDSFSRASTLFQDNGAKAAGPRSTASTLVGSLHDGDEKAAQIHARTGDVSGDFIIAKAVNVSAGRDVKDLSLIAQNLAAGDVTTVSAGRDVVYSVIADDKVWRSTKDSNGVIGPNLEENTTPAIKIFGPGLLEVSAGRTVDLANSDGIVSKGPGVNSYLPDTGASIRVVAGKSTDLDTALFASTYLATADVPAFMALSKAAQLELAQDVLRLHFIETYGLAQDDGAYRAQWLTFAGRNKLDANPARAEAAMFDRFRYEVLWVELSASGLAGSTKAKDAKDNPGKYSAEELTPEALYGRGFKALELAGLGDVLKFNSSVRMLFSQIRSQSGGDVDVLVPGGSLDVGPIQMADDVEVSRQGLVANQGNSRVFVRDSINVNTSRWFAIDGGNLLGWASYGDIDAGKGPRSAVSGSSQRLDVDKLSGKITLVDGGASTGSGIATIFNRPVTKGGDIEPYTPRGLVNAGEAGIRAAGGLPPLPNLVGGDMVMAVGGGGSAPTPPAPSISLGAPAGDKSAERTMADAPSNAGKSREANSVLTVEVVANADLNASQPTGAGSDKPESVEEEKGGTRRKSPAAKAAR
ncbi:hypothetical protein GCM10027046_09130 [Uliginosibacterium flavum]|uniref:Filamentous hemagglutinin N-terminal domain-containing protein n=1 Tax=Uliginosibacterium flavum TaxID=1396831 RepID=A0ABV2TJD0_9RHOO